MRLELNVPPSAVLAALAYLSSGEVPRGASECVSFHDVLVRALCSGLGLLSHKSPWATVSDICVRLVDCDIPHETSPGDWELVQRVGRGQTIVALAAEVGLSQSRVAQRIERAVRDFCEEQRLG